MSCTSCGHAMPHDSAFCESCGAPQGRLCPACGTESRSAARFCRTCGSPLDAAIAEPAINPPAQQVGVARATTTAGARRLRSVSSDSAGAQSDSLAPRRISALMKLSHDDQDRSDEPLWAWDGSSPSGVPPHPSRMRSVFTGREVERGRLTEALKRARGGAATLVEIAGAAGIGKSRLVQELRATTAEGDPCWFEVSAGEGQRYAPLQLASDLLLAMLGPSVCSPEPAALAGALHQLLPNRDSHALGHALAGYLRPGALDDAMTSEQRRRLIVYALRQTIEALARRHPLGLILDNLHLADASSVTALQEILPALNATPVLVVAISEPPFSAPWTDAAVYCRLPLGGLTDSEAAPLLESLTAAALDPDTLAFLVERTGGNPLFLETLTRVLCHEGYLELHDGMLRLPLRRYVLVPASLEELYQLQIERLGESIRLALGPAVVLGETFTLRQLRELVRTERTWAVPDTLLTGNIAHLLESELVEALEAPDSYRFRHELIRMVAADVSPALRTSRLHTLLGRLLEAEATHWTGRRLQRLAYHFGQGDRPAKGIEYHSRAGEHALCVQAFAEAQAHFLAGIERLAEAGTAPDRSALVETLTAGLATARAGLGHFESAEAGFRAALAACNDPLPRAEVLCGLAGVLAKQWRQQEALLELGEEAGALRNESGEPALLASLRLQLRRIELLRELGWYADAEEAAMEALAAAGAHDAQFDTRISPLLQEAVARICAALGEIKVVRRDLQAAEDLLQRARSIAERLPDRRCAAAAAEQLAHLAWLRGDLDASAEAYARARELQREAGDPRGEALATHNLALVHWRQSRVTEAETYLLEALGGLELAGELETCRAAIANLERVYWYRGDFEQLEVLQAKKRSLADDAGWDLQRESLLFQGRRALERGELAEAEQRLRDVFGTEDPAADAIALEASILLGEALLAADRLVDAADVLAYAQGLAQQRRELVSQGAARLALAELQYRRGDEEAAAESASEAVALVSAPDQRQRLGARHLLGRYCRFAARLAGAGERWSDADAAFRQSLELFEGMEAHLEAARTRMLWAESLGVARERSAASDTAARTAPRLRALLTDALETFRRSGLAVEIARAEAALAQL